MKKFRSILVVIFALMVSVIFSACKDTYKFGMKFYMDDKNISEVNLYIDENNVSETKQIKVEFSKIKSGKIRPIEISISQAGVASITDEALDGKTYSFNITALAPVNQAKLTVRHLSSNKSASVTLNIHKRSSEVTSLNKTYVLGIPKSNGDTPVERTATIDAKQILNYDGTENVYFSLPSGIYLPEGVRAEYITVDGKQYISAFNISSEVINGSSVTLNPVFSIPNFYTDVIRDPVQPTQPLEITVKFVRLLDANDITLNVNNYDVPHQDASYQSDYEAGVPIVMLYNDSNYKFLQVGFSTGNEIEQQLYKDCYLQPECLSSNSFSSQYNADKFMITANAYAEQEEITFNFAPNPNYVGEIKSVQKGILLSSCSRAVDLKVFLENNLQDDISDVTIYDTYVDKLGGQFNFVPDVNEIAGLDQFNFMRLVVKSNLLDVNLTANEGVNNVYSQHTYNKDGTESFDGQITSNGNRNFKTNSNLLQIYFNYRPMKFWYDETNSSFVSESFVDTDNIYIKYTKNTSTASSSENLSLKVENFYKPNGKNVYFEKSTPKPENKIISFNTQIGVTDFDVVAGIVGEQNNLTHITKDGNNIKAEHLALNKGDNQKYVLNIDKVLGKVMDEVAQPVTEASFNVKISADDNQQNGVKIAVDGLGYADEINSENAIYDYNSTTQRVIYLNYKNADLGYYTLTISHPSGIGKQIPIFVYEDVSADDIGDLVLKNSDSVIDNNTNEYADVAANYIVPADANSQIGVSVNESASGKFNLTYNGQNFYNFNLSFEMQYANSDANTTNRQASDFVTSSLFSQSDKEDFDSAFGAYLTFKTNANNEAGYFENGKNYIKVKISLKNKFTFENILANPTENESEGTNKEISFYIYKKLDRSNLSIAQSNNEIYYNNYLGLNFENSSKTNLTLNYLQDSDIWNYLDKEVEWTQSADLGLGDDENESDYFTMSNDDNKTQLSLQFLKQPQNANFLFTATLTQFGKTVQISKSVQVGVPVITKTLVVGGIDRDVNNHPYLDLQVDSEGYSLVYQQLAEEEVTHGGISLYVYSRRNSRYTISLSNENVSFEDGKILVAKAGQVQILAVATDVIKSALEGSYNTSEEFIEKFINPTLSGENPYLDAFKIIDLYITDGSQASPYILDSVDDFKNLQTTDTNNKWFVLMHDLNLEGLNAPIKSFAGHIITQGDEIVNLNVVLNNDKPNLFSEISKPSEDVEGSIKNVAFNVGFGYNYSGQNQNLNLGVIGKNSGSLTNVFVTYEGTVTMPENGTVYFGGLVGENKGDITYTSTRSAVINRNPFTLSGSAEVYFGGLVGLNNGQISGKIAGVNLGTGEKTVEFVNDTNSGATAQINIVSNNEKLGAVGGLVGKNAGTIKQVLVRGNIAGHDNVGGIIGKNETTQQTASISYANDVISNITYGDNEFYVTDCISQVVLSGDSYVGGIVGHDTNGEYNNCAYQIYQTGVALSGTSRVGGIAGYSQDGWFNLCYVFSYKWDYSHLNLIGTDADISGDTYVAGIAGEAKSSWSDTSETNISGLIISQSSVNAYLKATAGDLDNVSLAGILNANTETEQHSAIWNAYFIGKLDGDYQKDGNRGNLVLSNINSSSNGNYTPIYGNAYSVIYEEKTNLEGNWPTSFNIKQADNPVWGIDNTSGENKINGGYIYLLKDGSPLFELSPTNITATVNEKNNDVRGAYKIGDTTIYLSYYNFDLDVNAEDYQQVYNRLQKYNTYPILAVGDKTGLLNFNWSPEEIKTLRLATKSNANFLQFENGNLVVRGIGSISIEFASQLNPNKKVSVNVIVGYPFGTAFRLKESLTSLGELDEDKTFGVGVNKTRDIVATFTGTKAIDEGIQAQQYKYSTNSSIKYKVTATLTDASTSDKFSTFIAENITIGGQNFALVDEIYTLTTDNLSITVKEKFDGEITFTVLPVLLVEGTELSDESLAKTFKFMTLAGATKLEMQSKGGVVYPNTILEGSNSFDVDILTDFAYSENDLNFANNSVDSKSLLTINIYKEIISDGRNDWQQILLNNIDITSIINFALKDGNKKIVYNEETQRQTLSFDIKFEQFKTLLGDDSNPHRIKFEFVMNGGSDNKISNYTIFDLLPQQIYSVNIRNYKYNPQNQTETDDDAKRIEESEYLFPSTSGNLSYGLIVIDMYPINAYFDYLEIRDITTNTNTRINFVQVDSNFNRVGIDTPTSDGRGTRLNKLAGDKIYALTQIGANAEEIEHSIEVVAYANTTGGTATALKTGVLNVQIRLQPEIVVDYLKPDRTVYDTARNNEANHPGEIANGVDAEFRLTTNNLSNMQTSLDFVDENELKITDFFNLVALNNGYYRLTYLKTDTDTLNKLIGKKVHVAFTGIRVLNTGEELTTTTGFDLTITWFMVYGVSLTNTRTIGGETQIVGNYQKPLNFEFYFSPSDVSYYLNNGSSYHYTDQTADSGAQKIIDILKVLNGNSDNPSIDIDNILKWYTSLESDEDGNLMTGNLVKNENLRVNGIDLNREIIPPRLVVENDTIKCVELKFYLTTLSDGYKSLTDDETGVKFSYRYTLNFTEQTPLYSAVLVKNEQDFYNMAGEGTNYILGKDLVFDEQNPYTPFELNVANFDGNGHTIKISAFATLAGTEIEAGLFTSIAQNTTVQNLQVEYNLGKITGGTRRFVAQEEYTLGDRNSLYDSIHFGGLAAVNNGVITNCKVTGNAVFNQSNINLSAIQQQNGENISPFDLGGLVYQNTSTAYITNCVCDLKISAMANIGGLVHTNEGKITTSYFDANVGLMYVYLTSPLTDPNNGNLSYDLDAHSAGFVYQNTGSIDMCYVVSGQTSGANDGYLGNLAAKNNYAGFAYINSGTISNAYTDVLLVNLNSANFSGFVDSNSGSIKNCYTFVNGGEQLDNNQFTFAPNDLAGELENCYTVVKSNVTLNNTDKIKSIEFSENTVELQERFNGFTFGDNKSAVWQLTSTDKLPKLSATMETIAFTQQENEPEKFQVSENGLTKNVTRYFGWKNVDLYDDETNKIDFTNYGTKQNPYVIYSVESWNSYFENDNLLNGYYRLVKDIDFNISIPYTSKIKFAGNLQGNGLTISNFGLSTLEDLTAIGLFSELDGNLNNYEENAVRNLSIVDADISAIKTQAVGGLAGIITNYKLYNITLDSEHIILGENAIGGLAGLIRGKFDVQTIRSNISGHSDYQYATGNYTIYQSKLNNVDANSLDSVHYSGSVAGIVDAYDEFNPGIINLARRKVGDGYRISDIVVDGQILQISGTVGGAFGLINEYTNLDGVSVNIANSENEALSKLSGYQFSAGVVGENRGVITNATFTADNEKIFNSSRVVSAGLVGLNLGYVGNSSAEFNAIRTDADINNYSNTTSILAGLVGRDVNGYLQNCTFSGQILSIWSSSTEITAGAIGTRYTKDKMAGGSSNQLTAECVSNVILDTFSFSDYADGVWQEIENRISNVTISSSAVDYWLENLQKIYSIRDSGISFALEGNRVLSAGVGLQTQAYADLVYTFENGNFVINGSKQEDSQNVIGALENVTMFDGSTHTTPYANVFERNFAEDDNKVYVLYAVGAVVNEFDVYTRLNYNGEMMLLARNISSAKTIFVNKNDEVKDDRGIATKILTQNVTLSENSLLSYTIYLNSDLEAENNAFTIDLIESLQGAKFQVDDEVKEVSPTKDSIYKITFNNGQTVSLVVGETTIEFNFVH